MWAAGWSIPCGSQLGDVWVFRVAIVFEVLLFRVPKFFRYIIRKDTTPSPPRECRPFHVALSH